MSDNKNEGVVRSYSGYVKVSEKMTTGMLTVRGEFKSSKFKTSFTKAVGTKLPKDREVISVSYTHLTLPTSDLV